MDSIYSRQLVEETKDKTTKKTSDNRKSSEIIDNSDGRHYKKGSKYDPRLYHTDYAGMEEERREFIDNDGYDDNDAYDEFYGYGWRQ